MTGSSDSNLNPGLKPNTSMGGDDPFLHLHKMSTTAGLGSGDYVAINGAAIFCLILGLNCAWLIFDSAFFLILPLAGLVVGVVAWQQISKSNGTQTGREIAAIGLLLCLGIGGFFTASKVYATFRNGSDENQIVNQTHKLGDLIHAGKYADAYGLFDDDFKKKFSLQEFETNWKRFSASPYLGNVRSIDWNKLLTFDINPVDNSRQANGMMLLYCKPTDPIRVHLSFKNVDGVWLIDQFPELFVQNTSPTGGGAGGGDKGTGLIGPPKPK